MIRIERVDGDRPDPDRQPGVRGRRKELPGITRIGTAVEADSGIRVGGQVLRKAKS